MKTPHKFSSILAWLGLIIASLLMFNYSAYGQNTITNLTDNEDIKHFTELGLNELDISGINIIIFPINALPQYRNNSGINGLLEVETITEHLTIYRMFINDSRSWSRITRTISHELIHVLQYYEGRINREGDKYIFEDEVYTESFPYRMRPWEAEAFNNSPNLRQTILSNIK